MKAFICIIFFVVLCTTYSWSISDTDEDMPWDTPLEKIKTALTGKTVMIIGIILIAGAGIMLAASDGGQAKQRIFFIVLGIGVAMNAPRVLALLFGQGAGLLLPS